MIESIHLNNFKCFKNQSLMLGSLTLLTGLNGAGKSTVIQSLLLLRQTFFQNALDSGGLVLNGDLISIGIGQDALYQDASKEEIGFSLETKEKVKAAWQWKYEPLSDFLPLTNKVVNKDFYQSAIFSNNFQYLAAERIGPRTSFKTSQYDVRNNKKLGVRGEYTIHYLSIFGDEHIKIKELIHPNAQSNSLKSQVEAWMGTISPGTRLKLNAHSDIDLVSMRYQFIGDREKTNEFRPTNVGFGLTNVLPVITAILTSSPGTLLLIENPEAHLHPHGQSEMGKLIAIATNSGVQIIVETHSDHVLNGIRVAVKNKQAIAENIKIHFFERQWKDVEVNHQVISPVLDKNGRIDRWPIGFFDEWDNNLDKLI